MIPIPDKYKNSWKDLKFIDLFAGIGGFHYALQSFGAKCVFASEWDEAAAKVYFNNFAMLPDGDITKIDESEIPPHDILCGGFPCQAFSIAGKQKGFEDTRGTLFFDIARIVDFHRPKILILENVKNFISHDNGNTLKVVLNIINDLDYNSFYSILNASNFGLPQNRERFFLVAFDKSLGVTSFFFPNPRTEMTSVSKILDYAQSEIEPISRNDIDIYKEFKVEQDIFGEKRLPNRPIQIGKVNKGGQGERIYHIDGHAITLSAYGGGIGAKTGLYKVNGGIRRLTPRECARVQGFPESHILSENKNDSYKQFGNSVAVNVVQSIVLSIIRKLQNE